MPRPVLCENEAAMAVIVRKCFSRSELQGREAAEAFMAEGTLIHQTYLLYGSKFLARNAACGFGALGKICSEDETFPARDA